MEFSILGQFRFVYLIDTEPSVGLFLVRFRIPCEGSYWKIPVLGLLILVLMVVGLTVYCYFVGIFPDLPGGLIEEFRYRAC
jgi:hypothetical protein